MSRWLPALLGLAVVALVAHAAPPRHAVVSSVPHLPAPWAPGCYGSPDSPSPSTARLARDALRFTPCFSSNAVCSPTRATYLTRLLPSQHGVHSYLRAGESQTGPGSRSMIAEFRTLPKILADAGYVCGLTHKWHLGGNLTPPAGLT